MITHLDIIPTFVDQARPVLNTFVADSADDPGVQTFAMLSRTPTTNHFQLIEVFANQQAYDALVSAQHTVDFRQISSPPLARPTMNGCTSSSTGDIRVPTPENSWVKSG